MYLCRLLKYYTLKLSRKGTNIYNLKWDVEVALPGADVRRQAVKAMGHA